MRPPTEISGGKKARPKSSLGFGSSQPRWGKKVGVGKTAKFADRMEGERAKIDAEKNRVINQNLKVFYDALKADLEKPDEELFNDKIPDKRFMVRDAKNCNKSHSLMRYINNKLHNTNTTSISKLEFRQLVQAFCKLSDSQCSEIFNSLTKKSETKGSMRNLDQQNNDLRKDNESPKSKGRFAANNSRGGGRNQGKNDSSFKNNIKDVSFKNRKRAGGINVNVLRENEDQGKTGGRNRTNSMSPSRESPRDNVKLELSIL